jgi:predicted dehydrogenase
VPSRPCPRAPASGPPFYRPERYTLRRSGHEPQIRTARLTGHGFTDEAEEVARCLRAGRAESPVMPLDGTLAVMRTLDAARAASGCGGQIRGTL